MQPQMLARAVPEVLWINANPSFQWLHRGLISSLASHHAIACWEYSQSLDVSASLEDALVLLHDYIRRLERPIHLLGHGTGGLVGLLYAQQYPASVRSLGLLSVGANPVVDWQAHYYALLELLPCDREQILSQMVRLVFGIQPWRSTKYWIAMLERDLLSSPSPHSLLRRVSISPCGAEVPLFICGGEDDGVIDLTQLRAWKPWLKPGDCLWKCPAGNHFFHVDCEGVIADQILDFWNSHSTKDRLRVDSPVRTVTL